MTRKVKPTAVKIVAQALSDMQGKFKLRRLGKGLTQANVISNRLVNDRTYHWHKLAFELAEQFADRCGGQALISVINVRISNMLVRSKVGGIFPAQVERPFEIGHHDRKVVRRPCSCPCIV